MLLTIIVPTRNEARNIEACLACVAWAAGEGQAEILVVDNSSSDGTPALAVRAGTRVIAQGPERSSQRNRGARDAAGDFVFFLDADMRVPRPTLEEIVNRLRVAEPPDALYVREHMVGEGWWTRVRNFERSFYDGTCIDGLRVIRRSLFQEIGGFDEALFAGEDWDLDRRLLSRTRNIAITGGALLHDEGRFSLVAHLRKKRYYAGNFGEYCRKWGHDATIRKQFGARYRFWTVFMEDGRWKRSLRRPDLLFGIWLYKALVGAVFFTGTRRAFRAPDAAAPLGDGPASRQRTVFLLTISFRPEVGGVETRLDQICRTIVERGHRVVVYTYQPIITNRRGPAHEVGGPIEVHRVSWIGHDLFHKLETRPVLQMLYLSPYLFLRAAVFLLGRSRRMDVIHAAGFNAGLAARFLHTVYRIPYVVSTHSTYNFRAGTSLSRGIAWILRRARAVIAVSSESADELVRIGVDPKRVIRHTTWVDLERFSPLPRGTARQTLGWGERFTAMFVGRLKEVKGVDALLAAARRMPDVSFTFVGVGDLDEEIRRAAREMPNVIHAGYVENERLATHLSAADVLVLPSSREGFPRVVAESLACGTPVIAPDMPGIASVLNESVAILIAPSAVTIERAIREWAARYLVEADLRERARRFAEGRFSSRNVSEILAAYGWEGCVT
jgi:glycosyltransferase involved in cell wall biosynthesis